MAPTTGDRDAKLAALHQRLADQVRELRTGEDWTRWLAVACRFHSYSFNNTLLILAQRPDATTVAGYRAWQALGRQVDKGERGVQILAPVLRKAEATDPEPDETDRAVRIAGYRVTYVWDVSQTSGQPLPERPSAQLLKGHAPEGLWDSLAAVAHEQGFTLRRSECGQANGLTHFGDRTITVRPDVDDAQAVKTLTHELGHVLLHEPGQGVPAVTCRGVIEVEAESVAYLIAASHDLDTGSYTFPYVVGWAGSVAGRAPEEVVADVGQRVLRATNQILDRVDLAPDAEVMDDARLDAVNRPHLVAAATSPSLHEGPAHATTTSIEVDGEHRRLYAAMADAADFFERQLAPSWAPDYLAQRGLAGVLDETSPWQVGYAPKSWTALTDHLREAGYSDETLEAAGLGLRARTGRLVDRFRDRLILPIRDGDGRVVAFVGRAHPHAGKPTPKYLNSPTTSTYRKGEHLLGSFEGRASTRDGATPVVVEGPIDALAVSVASPDRHAPVAPCGTALTSQQADTLLALAGGSGGPVVVATDADEPGRAAAEVAYRHLTARGLQPWAADLPPGIDPAELLERHGPRRLAATLTSGARPLIDDVIDHRVAAWSDHLRWVEGKVGAVRDIAPFIAALPPDQRARPIAHVVDLVGVEATTARHEVSAAVAANRARDVARHARATGSSVGRNPTAPSTSAPRRTAAHRSISR